MEPATALLGSLWRGLASWLRRLAGRLQGGRRVRRRRSGVVTVVMMVVAMRVGHRLGAHRRTVPDCADGLHCLPSWLHRPGSLGTLGLIDDQGAALFGRARGVGGGGDDRDRNGGGDDASGDCAVHKMRSEVGNTSLCLEPDAEGAVRGRCRL